ncbi:hypothetical protein IWW48_004505 [Coemansia sp. RSA 1200]|nr:hypothetical protein IWW48_004505 [Coemansia sp. RSA 1200]
MNGAGGNSTRLMFDDDDDINNGTVLCSIMFSTTSLVLILALFKVIYERWVTPLSKVPGDFIHSVTSVPMRYHMLRGTLPEFLVGLHRRHGILVRISPQRVSIADPDLVRQVLGSNQFLKTPSYDMPSTLEPNAFSTRSPELSVERRKQVGPGFSHRHLSMMEPKVIECGVTNLRRKLDSMLLDQQQQQPATTAAPPSCCPSSSSSVTLQYYSAFSLITLDTIGILGFGQRFGALANGSHELVRILIRIRIFNYITMVLPWFKKLPAILGKRLQTLARLVVFGQQAIAGRRREIEKQHRGYSDQTATAGVPVDLLQMMLDTGRSEGDKRAPMTDPQIVSESILHLIAGVDTTSSGLTWTLALLLHNPHIMKRLTDDIRREFPPSPSSTTTTTSAPDAEGNEEETSQCDVITFEDCKQRLPYLGAVIAESLRVLSPAPGMLPRLAPAAGLRLAGYHLPAGTWLCCALGATHMNPAVYPSPQLFDPDRFMATADQESERARQNLLAFSNGVRACLGRNLALVEMHLVLANLLRDYDLRLPDDCSPASALAAAGADDCEKGGSRAATARLTGVIPDIPHSTLMTLNPTNPDRDCRVVVSRAVV